MNKLEKFLIGLASIMATLLLFTFLLSSCASTNKGFDYQALRKKSAKVKRHNKRIGNNKCTDRNKGVIMHSNKKH